MCYYPFLLKQFENNELLQLKECSVEIKILYIIVDIQNGWFQKISIPIPRAASRNSEGEEGLRRLEFRGHGGVTSTGIPRTWGGFIGLEFRRHTGFLGE